MVSSISNGLLPLKAHAAVVVAHPDDEILWCGGFILSHPEWHWRIVTLCRASDSDRAPKFRRVLEHLNADGEMADMDDGPEQVPLDSEMLGETVQNLLANERFDVVFTHGPRGEYTRHRRHEECCRTVVALWDEGRIMTDQLRLFAYEDGGGSSLPKICGDANHRLPLADELWRRKLKFITEVYGFADESWETRATSREEGFHCFESSHAAIAYLQSNQTPP